MATQQPIGIFDSGYGGLTVMKDIVRKLPEYDYIYLGDNARAPYGPRSFDSVYRYTLQCVQWFFQQKCPLVILACNTASAKALRTIQQNDLPAIDPLKRVLGVIRPTTELIGRFSATKHVGILATAGTVESNSYVLEINKFFPEVVVSQEPCPMWVPLIENNEHETPGADYFVKKHISNILAADSRIDTLLLACTHYPLLLEKIRQFLPADVSAIVSQGGIVAGSLEDYLQRHPQMKERISKHGRRQFYTTDSTVDFDNHGTPFFGEPVTSIHVDLEAQNLLTSRWK